MMFFILSWVGASFGMESKKALKKSKIEQKSLMQAVEENQIPYVEFLLNKKKENPDQEDTVFKRRPLHWAAMYGYLAIAKLLIAYKAELNASDAECKAPLHYAVENDNREIAALLLEKGARVNKKACHNMTPLFFATDTALIRLLLAYGADIDRTDRDGETALHAAVRRDQLSVAAFLLKQGSDPHVKDLAGWAPLNKASKGMASLLLAHGADITVLTKEDEEETITMLKELVEDIMTNKIIQPLKPASLVSLCCIREYCTDSLLDKEYLPRDMFKVIKDEAEKLSVSFDQVEKLTTLFADNGYKQSNPAFMQKLHQYKNSCL